MTKLAVTMAPATSPKYRKSQNDNRKKSLISKSVDRDIQINTNLMLPICHNDADKR